jgi:hypothetical protein
LRVSQTEGPRDRVSPSQPGSERFSSGGTVRFSTGVDTCPGTPCEIDSARSRRQASAAGAAVGRRPKETPRAHVVACPSHAAAEMRAPWTPLNFHSRPPRLGNLGSDLSRFPHSRKPTTGSGLTFKNMFRFALWRLESSRGRTLQGRLPFLLERTPPGVHGAPVHRLADNGASRNHLVRSARMSCSTMMNMT